MSRSSAENDYLTWLVRQMNVVEGKNYGMLLRELYRHEFYSIVKYDEDRGADGLVLRRDWADEVGYRGPLDFGPPRVLETIIGISLRIEDQIFGGPWADEWEYVKIFWDLINNLELLDFDGVLSNADYENISDVLERFLSKNVTRGHFVTIFKIFAPESNFRKMNLWGQMHLYIAEKWPGNVYF